MGSYCLNPVIRSFNLVTRKEVKNDYENSRKHHLSLIIFPPKVHSIVCNLVFVTLLLLFLRVTSGAQ